MDRIKLIYANGDSWTAGDIVDPELFGDDGGKVNDPRNKAYRLPRVWPNKLAKKLGIDAVNNSHAGGSNDRILRSTINDVLNLIKTYNSEDIFVIIGWSSPERKDFFYKWDKEEPGGEWECLYPSEFKHWTSEREELNSFFKLYTLNHWYEEEYITRHCLNTISLHYFLKGLGIKHLFFNAFYEDKEFVLSEDAHQLFDPSELQTFMVNFKKNMSDRVLKRLEVNNSLEEYNKIYKTNFIKKSFVKFLLENNEFEKDKLIDYHPTELGHKLWAEYLYTVLKND